MISGQIENGILHLSSNDPVLSRVISLSGPCTLKQGRNYFWSLVESIISQQLSGIAADSIISRVYNFYNRKPVPDEILNTPDNILRTLGLSYQKIKYIKYLSAKISTKELDLKKLSSAPDEEIIASLTMVNGIGVWTVQMFLIFTLNRMNILPLNDLGIRKAVMNVYNLRKLPDEKKIISISRKYNWTPYCSIASWYLWKSLEL